jgi:4-hydroxy-tetrahydrodipicolinate synthase
VPRFDHLRGVFGLLPTPYRADYEIDSKDLASAAEFCCSSRQHGIVWPVMVGEFYLLGETERVRNLDVILETVDGRLPVVFGCSGSSIPQTVMYASAAERAGADAVIAMPPPDATPSVASEMFHRMAEVCSIPIIIQNAAERVSLNTDHLGALLDAVPTIEYIKEERPPGAHHISEIRRAFGDRVKTIFGGFGGRLLPEELSRGAQGSMPACELADVLARVVETWWSGDESGARALHARLLPLIIRETHPFMRHVLVERGVFRTTVERAAGKGPALDEDDRREISVLVEAIADQLGAYPFGALSRAAAGK